ncbi:sulfate adenylyltransferase subunit 1 [Elysia marginata]|uniref:sulfate adenylyltransferase n=1 Tax=Elysia marginata TaxID=1093978 RepID=A0AAV4FQI9_9GAST|nr:sulfate adenylyltransferase subunit 1 [Elysia marginata]
MSTAGSVDDGKSTLIGRLLYDNNALTKEQEALIIKKTKEKGLKELDFSVLTDGLMAEREQGITIDVAHIYFSTKTRKFIIADSPGHVEYTRNMVTGSSNAQVSIILIDARKGLLEQSYRHFYISQLLRLKTVVFCINKMDLVDYSEDTYLKIKTQIETLLASYKHSNPNIKIVPISSLKGDNVVHKSANMTWYKGQTLNSIIHYVKPSEDNYKQFRMDVQNVLHVQNADFVDYRGVSGRIASGNISLGDYVRVLPSKTTAKVSEIRKYKTLLNEAKKGESVLISLDREVDVSRGSMLVKDNEETKESRVIDATLVWLEESLARKSSLFGIQAGSKIAKSKLTEIVHIIPPEQPENVQKKDEIKLNDIAEVKLQLSLPMYFDPYQENKANGIFILINPTTNNTCAVGFVQ